MGLKEKQALAGLDFGWAEKRIAEYTGVTTRISVQPETVADDLDAIFMLDTKGAVSVANAIAKVCYNAIGKEAFGEKKVVSILLINHKEAGVKKVVIQAGALELHGSWGAASDYLSEDEIKDAIENQL